jgi:hypothetical protein
LIQRICKATPSEFGNFITFELYEDVKNESILFLLFSAVNPLFISLISKPLIFNPLLFVAPVFGKNQLSFNVDFNFPPAISVPPRFLKSKLI